VYIEYETMLLRGSCALCIHLGNHGLSPCVAFCLIPASGTSQQTHDLSPTYSRAYAGANVGPFIHIHEPDVSDTLNTNSGRVCGFCREMSVSGRTETTITASCVVYINACNASHSDCRRSSASPIRDCVYHCHLFPEQAHHHHHHHHRFITPSKGRYTLPVFTARDHGCHFRHPSYK